jgi:hypothetical protein
VRKVLTSLLLRAKSKIRHFTEDVNCKLATVEKSFRNIEADQTRMGLGSTTFEKLPKRGRGWDILELRGKKLVLCPERPYVKELPPQQGSGKRQENVEGQAGRKSR